MLIFYNFQLHLYILDEELFTDGTLLGSVRGPAHTGVVPIEALSPSPQGHYVIFQKDNTQLEEDRQQLRVAEFVAYGSYDASIEGSINILITLACGRFVRFRSSLTTNTCKKRVMLRRRLFWPKKNLRKKCVNRDKM